jgi:hypothetical protein
MCGKTASYVDAVVAAEYWGYIGKRRIFEHPFSIRRSTALSKLGVP